ncbi:MAG: SLC13/DASS family transporter [Deltaproteobacteria bacterium]|nr:SLC13/DASS family transporter [Deltaproteobacteria bacterium]
MGRALQKRKHRVEWAGFFLGPALGLLTLMSLPVDYLAQDGQLLVISQAGRITAGLAVWMAVWWMTEAIPIYATALLPVTLLPLTGALPLAKAAAPYAHHLIFMFMGGFILALSMQRWGLHRRIAFFSLQIAGARPAQIVACFMALTAFLSMWVSNTATAIMMAPVAISIIQLNGTDEHDVEHGDKTTSNFAVCLLLGIAYAASIGGTATLIGTPPNLFLASFYESQFGQEIGFVRWMGVGLPLALVFLPLCWFFLTRLLYPLPPEAIEGSDRFLKQAYENLGPMNRGSWITLVVFLMTASLWISRPLLQELSLAGRQPFVGLSDAGIAMAGALLLFMIPVDLTKREFTMDWETALKLPWGLLILFGGGLSLAQAIRTNGVGEFIASQVGLISGAPPYLIVVAVTLLIIFLTELTSNTATTATFVPILASMAPALGMEPLLLIVPAALAASCAFMLPVATPPNAIVFGTGRISIPQMTRAGIWLNLLGVLLIPLATYLLAYPLLKVTPN